MNNLNDFGQRAMNNAKTIVKNVKRGMKVVKTGLLFVAKLFMLALKLVWTVLKGLVLLASSTTGVMILLVILISTFGVVTVIISGELDFILKGTTVSDEGDPLNGLSPDDGDLYYMAVCEALDIDKISQWFTANTNGFKAWYENNYLIDMNHNENPAKMIDLFMLNDEIYNRSEINGDSYEFLMNKAIVIGDFMVECSTANRKLGEGSRLWNSEISYECNSSGYCDPFGNNPKEWLMDNALDSHDTVGYTFVSRYEKDTIDNAHRAVYGSVYSIRNGKAGYPSEGNITRKTMSVVGTSDDVATYLDTIKLNHPISSRSTHNNLNSNVRGFATWIPDAFYTLAMQSRVYAEGYDYSTHNTVPGDYRYGGNVTAMTLLMRDVNISKEEAGTIMNFLYCGRRHYNAIVDCMPGSPDFDGVSSSSCRGEGIALSTIFYLEGVLDEIADSYDGSLRNMKNGYFADDISQALYGPTNSHHDVTSLSEDSYYKKILDKIEHGTAKHQYPSDWAELFKLYNSNWSSIYSALHYGSSYEKQTRLVYGMTCYVAGQIILKGMRKLIQACYDYQDSNGKYVFRLKNISAELQNIITTLDESKLPPLSPSDPAYSDPSLINTANPVAEYAVRWACGVCDNNKIGYSQKYRNTATEYDCSSLVNTAYALAGVNAESSLFTFGKYKYVPGDVETTHYGYEYYTRSGAFECIYDGRPSSTKLADGGGNGVLLKSGEDYADRLQLQRGDILWFGGPGRGDGHVEIYVGNKKNAGAHTDSDKKRGDSTSDGREVNVSKYNSHAWYCVFRYKGPMDIAPWTKDCIWYKSGIGQYP